MNKVMELSLSSFTNIYNYFTVNFDEYLSIPIKDGKIKGQFEYEANKWNKITVYINYGDSNTDSVYTIEVNGVKKTGEKKYL